MKAAKSNSIPREELGLDQRLVCDVFCRQNPFPMPSCPRSDFSVAFLCSPFSHVALWIREVTWRKITFCHVFSTPPNQTNARAPERSSRQKGRNRPEPLGREFGHSASGQPVLAPVTALSIQHTTLYVTASPVLHGFLQEKQNKPSWCKN